MEATHENTVAIELQLPRIHNVLTWAKSRGSVRSRYALIMGLGRTDLTCSRYDKHARAMVAVKDRVAAAIDTRVRGAEDFAHNARFAACRTVRTARRS